MKRQNQTWSSNYRNDKLEYLFNSLRSADSSLWKLPKASNTEGLLFHILKPESNHSEWGSQVGTVGMSIRRVQSCQHARLAKMEIQNCTFSQLEQVDNLKLKCRTLIQFQNRWWIRITSRRTMSRKAIKTPIRYLGVNLDSRLNMNQHVRGLVDTGNAIFRYLCPLLSRNSRLSREPKILLINLRLAKI